MTKWRFIDSETQCASWNMAIDETLLNTYDTTCLPIFRLYSWKQSLSFGRFSKIEKNINLSKLDNLSYARRVTGGGILIHDCDISYTLILPKTYVKEYGVKKSYSYLCSFLMDFYKTLGLVPLFASQTNISCQRDDICLAGNESYDIIINKRKIGGNAQRYTKDALFQHGSIPIKFDKELFKPLFLNQSGLESAATLSNEGIKNEKDELKEILKNSFCKSFKCELIEDKLSVEEMQKAQHLFETKYSLDSWNIDGKLNN